MKIGTRDVIISPVQMVVTTRCAKQLQLKIENIVIIIVLLSQVLQK